MHQYAHIQQVQDAQSTARANALLARVVKIIQSAPNRIADRGYIERKIGTKTREKLNGVLWRLLQDGEIEAVATKGGGTEIYRSVA